MRDLALIGGIVVVIAAALLPLLVLVPWATKRGLTANFVALVAALGLPGTAAWLYGELLR